MSNLKKENDSLISKLAKITLSVEENQTKINEKDTEISKLE